MGGQLREPFNQMKILSLFHKTKSDQIKYTVYHKQQVFFILLFPANISQYVASQYGLLIKTTQTGRIE